MTIEEIREGFSADRFAKKNGLEIQSVDKNGSVIRAEIVDAHLNANGSVHGGMLFATADFAFGVAANFLHPNTVTASASITYVAPCRDTKYILARATEISAHKHTCVYSVTISDDKDNVVCVAQINGFSK